MCVGTETAVLETVPQGPFDVAISATSEDAALAEFIKGKMFHGSLGYECLAANILAAIITASLPLKNAITL